MSWLNEFVRAPGPHLTSEEAAPELARWQERGEPISDAAAAAVASWWQAPAGTGLAFAALASGRPLRQDDLREAVRAELLTEDDPENRRDLAALRAWAEAKHWAGPICRTCGARLVGSIASRDGWSHADPEDFSGEHSGEPADRRARTRA